MEFKLISRADAKAQGLNRYFTGKPCPKGHIAERKASNCGCTVCLREAVKGYYKTEKGAEAKRKYLESYRTENAENAKEYMREYRAENAERLSTASREYRAENASRIAENQKAWYAANAEQTKNRVAAWREANPELRRQQHASRRAAKLLRTVAWSDADAIKEVYATCPEGFQVDHIVPLQGELVSGLHVAYNLQHLSASENAAKCNRFDPETFDNDTWLKAYLTHLVTIRNT